MKKPLVFGIVFLVLMIGSAYATLRISRTVAGPGPDSQVFTGYLVCQSCATAKDGMAADGVNVRQHPELHTTKCLRMPSCVASGFGIFVRIRGGAYSYYKFDRRGSDLAYQSVVLKTVRLDHVRVAVTGRAQQQTLTVRDIVEK